jgi:hypothetical protein
MRYELPKWATELRSIFRSGSSSQFILYGNVFDLVELPPEGETPRYGRLSRFLTEVLFEPFDVVVHYDRGRGIRVRKGGEHFHRFLKVLDSFSGSKWASLPEGDDNLDLSNLLPRDAKRALELIDRFVRAAQHRTDLNGEGQRVPAPLKIAVLIDYAHLVVPPGEPLHLSGDNAETLIRVLDWASDPAITGAFVATVLVAESLNALNRAVVESPYAAKIGLDLPEAAEIERLVSYVVDDAKLAAICDVDRPTLGAKLVGLSRVAVRGLLLRALRGDERISQAYLTEVKKELIEKEAFGRIEFIESTRNLDDVAGHVEAKEWLRQDSLLLKRNRLRAIPMGYLFCGRIGTGKTYLLHCWAGEVGIPVVEIKNFRDRWVGATESNLERVFTILRALGQVIVFVDEADQMTGRRGAGSEDSGVSGRVYAMLAKEMSDTRNRGKLIWVFATSRPDLLEVDLKRQGRLDVHIPLFPPQDAASRRELFYAMARKVGIEISREAIPDPPDSEQVGGSEMEGLLVRAMRLYESQPDGEARRPVAALIADVVADTRPSTHAERLELMDLLAVKECTDARFLPPRYRDLSLAEVNRRVHELRMLLDD